MFLQNQVFYGTIKSWNPSKGWGHIVCDATHAMYEKDIFVMRSAVPGGHVAIGDQVSFNIVDGQKGPEASNVTVVSAKAAATGQFPAHAMFGAVKSYDAEKGWGHISCDETRNWYGKDMFFLKSSLMGQYAEIGDKVRFHIGMGAKDVEAQSIAVVGKSENKGFGGYFMPSPLQPAKKTPVPAPPNMQKFTGIVKSWNIEKGWGFIYSPETMAVYGKDIFLHRKQLFGQTPATGATLEFSVELGEDGRLVATHVNFPKQQQQKAPQRIPPQRIAPPKIHNQAANFWAPY
jgi:CspA family cold shock protein